MIEREEGTVRPAGPLLDALGVTVEIEDSQRLVEAVVIGKIFDLERDVTGLVIGASQGADWLTQRGLVEVARDVLRGIDVEFDD